MLRALTTFLPVLLAFAVAAPAAVIHVPADQPTIQDAIDAATAGDTVRVAPGTYAENLDLLGKAITVESESGAAVTTLDGGGIDSVVLIDSGEGPDSVLRGFTITGGHAFDGGGIDVAFASPTIEDNIITQNTACAGGGGVNLYFSSALVRRNVISWNGPNSLCSGGTGGGGVSITGAGSAQLLGNDIVDNSQVYGGGVELFAAGTPVLRGNLIARNSATMDGGGVSIFNDSAAILTDNVIADNTAGQWGGGIYWIVPSGAAGPRLVANTLVDNTATVGPALAIEGFQSGARLAGNILVGLPGGDVIYCQDQVPVRLANDVWSSGGTAWTGTCGDPTGTAGNLSQDPLFVDPLGGDFHLQASSPAIDAGADSAPELAATDFDGVDRRQDGDGDGLAVVDMGALEAAAPDGLLIDWNVTAYQGYSGQDGDGSVAVENGGETLALTGNRWLETLDTFDLTPFTVLEFDFMSTEEGEIHGIGFDHNNQLFDDPTLFPLFGTQDWSSVGIALYDGDYAGTGAWTSYRIPVGAFYTGSGYRLVLINDQDAGALSNTSRFRNVRIVERQPTGPAIDFGTVSTAAFSTQDGTGTETVEDGGATLALAGNRWRVLDASASVVVGPDTLVAFEYLSTAEGEVQGLALDADGAADPGETFRIFGHQGWGLEVAAPYQPADLGTWKTMVLPVGRYLGGLRDVVLVNDHDFGSQDGTSRFRDLRFYDLP